MEPETSRFTPSVYGHSHHLSTICSRLHRIARRDACILEASGGRESDRSVRQSMVSSPNSNLSVHKKRPRPVSVVGGMFDLPERGRCVLTQGPLRAPEGSMTPCGLTMRNKRTYAGRTSLPPKVRRFVLLSVFPFQVCVCALRLGQVLFSYPALRCTRN